MSSIGGIMGSARQGLYTNQKAIAVTSQNIANVNTVGYSRQRVSMSPISNLSGSRINYIERVRDEFLDMELMTAKSVLGMYSARDDSLIRLEEIVDETQRDGPQKLLDQFFRKIQDLTLNPSGLPERESVRSAAVELATVIRTNRRQLADLRDQQDEMLRQSITRVNEIANELASLNGKILELESATLNNNELRDRRDNLVSELSELTSVVYYEKSGIFTVAIGNGLTLVEGTHASQLEALTNTENEGYADIGLRAEGGNLIDITQRLEGGRIAGLVQVRDEDVGRQIETLDRLAAQLSTAFNVQHAAGFDLTGAPGGDFFLPVEVWTLIESGNAGDASVTAANVVDQSLLTFHDYEIRFLAGPNYEVVDTTTGATLTPPGGVAYVSGAPIAFDGVEVTISDGTAPPQAGDVFHVNTWERAGARIDIDPNIEASIDNIAASSDGSVGDNGNALALAALETGLFMEDGAKTFNQYLISNLTRVGVDVESSHRLTESQQTMTEQYSRFIQGYSGVSLDEESAYLLEYERAYQACARVISVADEMSQTVLQIV